MFLGFEENRKSAQGKWKRKLDTGAFQITKRE